MRLIPRQQGEMHVVAARPAEQGARRTRHGELFRPYPDLEGLCVVVGNCGPPFEPTVEKVMNQWVDVLRSDLWVLSDVIGRVEVRAGAASLRGATRPEVNQRVETGLADVGIGIEIPGRVEKGVGIAAFGGARCEVMLDGIKPGCRDVGVGSTVPFPIDEAARPQQIGRVRAFRLGRAGVHAPP